MWAANNKGAEAKKKKKKKKEIYVSFRLPDPT